MCRAGPAGARHAFGGGEVRAWLWQQRRLALNVRKGHIRSSIGTQPYLGYRISRQGIEVGKKATQRFRKRLALLARGDLTTLERSLASWRGVLGFGC